jgi:hypothetical protein
LPGHLFADRTPLKRGMNMYSIEQDKEIGQQASAEADKAFPLVTDSQITSYVNRLGQRLAQHAPGGEFQYTFKVIAQKEINAFALPGGPVYVNIGTITAAANESELAGVIGHEIGHVVMRHSTNQASKAGLLQGIAGLAGAKGGQVAGILTGLGAGLVSMKYSRDAESQADVMGAQILYDSGINPQGMVSFFETLSAEAGRGGPQFLSDHPNPGNRAQRVAQEVKAMGSSRSFTRDSADFQAVKRRAASVRAYTAQEIATMQKNGTIQNGGSTGTGTPTGPSTVSRTGVKPSGTFKTMSNQAMSMQYPDNWSGQQSQSGSVVIAPQGGADNGGVAYGVMIDFIQNQNNLALNDAATQLLAQVKQQNPGMTESSNWSNTTVGGKAARAVTLRGTSPLVTNGKNEQEKDWFIVTQLSDGTIASFVFVAPANDWSSLEPTYRKMLSSIQIK